jgi:hypothetical protein
VFNSYPARDVGTNLDVFFVIDRSQSMADPMWNKWDAFVSGFSRFLHTSAVDGIGIGVVYYPAMGNPDCSHCSPGECMCLANCGCPCNVRDPRLCPRVNICDATSYDRADVDIAPVAQNGSALLLSLATPFPGPAVIRPALEGGLEYASEHAEHNRDERVVVVLVAGGPPSSNDCAPNSISDCADAAGNSNTKTSVVAFDYGSGPDLDPVAFRGGGRLYAIDSHRDDVSMRFADVVSDLKNERSCQYDLPQDPIDTNRVSLQIKFATDGGGSSTTIARQVKDRQSCGGSPGWYYDRPDHPTRIIACDSTCGKIHGPPEASVEINVSACAPPP